MNGNRGVKKDSSIEESSHKCTSIEYCRPRKRFCGVYRCMRSRAWRSPYARQPRDMYESRKLKEHENNYATHDLELAAIVHALNMWRHYLMGKRFELRTDHCGMKCLFDHPTLNAGKARWLEFLCEFYFEIKHIKKKRKQSG